MSPLVQLMTMLAIMMGERALRAAQGPPPNPSTMEGAGATLGLECPCTVTDLDLYLDGGSISGSIVDANRRTLSFAWDGRERFGPGLSQDAPRLIYLGTKYPASSGSLPVLTGSPDETAVLTILGSYVDSHIPKSEQDTLMALPHVYARPNPPGSALAVEVLRIVKSLRQQRKVEMSSARDST